MKASAFATSLRDEIIKLTLAGQTSVATKQLTLFLDEKIPELEQAEGNGNPIPIDFQISHYKARQESAQQLFNSVIEYGKHALNAALIINAGAAISLLTFIGNLAVRLNLQSSASLANALVLFVLGVLAGAMAMGGAYCTQFYYAAEYYKMGGNTAQNKGAIRFHIATACFVVVAYVLFLSGAFISYSVLKDFGTH